MHADESNHLPPYTTPEREDDALREQRSFNLDAVDYLLAAVTLPLLLFALMFLTSEQARNLERARTRRLLGLWLLLAEVAIAGLVAWLVLR